VPDCWLCSNLFIATTLVAQKRKNDEYQQQVTNLSKDQVSEISKHFTNGGYVNFDLDAKVTWHYNKDSDTVTVTKVALTYSHGRPEAVNDQGSIGGYRNPFWDAIFVVKPDTALPNEPGGWNRKDVPGRTDLPGVDADYLWNMLKDNSFLMFAQPNGSYTWPNVDIRTNNNMTPYTVSRGSDGQFLLVKLFDRWRSGEVTEGAWNWVSWGEDPLRLSVNIPQRSTSSIDYHYNVSLANRLNSLIT